MLVKVISQPSDKHDSAGYTVYKVSIISGGGLRKVGYIMAGVYCVGQIKDIDNTEVYRTQAEAFRG